MGMVNTFNYGATEQHRAVNTPPSLPPPTPHTEELVSLADWALWRGPCLASTTVQEGVR